MMILLPDHDIAANKEPNANNRLPLIKTRFLPYMSAPLPKGSMQTAATRRYEEVTHPRVTTSRLNEELIAGNATFREDAVKGTRKEASDDMIRRIVFPAWLFMRE